MISVWISFWIVEYLLLLFSSSSASFHAHRFDVHSYFPNAFVALFIEFFFFFCFYIHTYILFPNVPVFHHSNIRFLCIVLFVLHGVVHCVAEDNVFTGVPSYLLEKQQGKIQHTMLLQFLLSMVCQTWIGLGRDLNSPRSGPELAIGIGKDLSSAYFPRVYAGRLDGSLTGIFRINGNN